jgi:outer membrane protein OmpA-like peptidoglycan-associated protein
MKKIARILILGAAVVAAAACSKSRAEQMKLAEKVQIVCTPEVLALVGDQIPVDLEVSYPDGYFHPKAILEVTPVLVYGGGEEVAGPTFTYQGEKVLDNYKVVAKSGGVVREHFAFDYEEGMEQAYLELRGVASFNGKEIAIPAVKVADGTVVTQLLAEASGEYSYKKDNYQAVLHEQTEGQVMYDYNSSTIKGSELRSRSIKELQAALEAIGADPRYTVRGTSVVAYASPEGGESYNAKLSDQRAASAQKAWSKVTGEKAPDNLEVRSIGQDWEGFREAVENSDIEDKDLILRVLSMYSDPAVRESEIKNMSKVYTEINKNVFPELRRARFITELDYQNFTDEELVELSKQAVDVLDEEGLLRVASISDDAARKAELYEKAVQKYASDRARFNLACLALDDNRPDAAAKYLDAVKEQDAAVLNAKGVVALQRGDRKEAAEWFRKSGTGEATANLGLVELLNGNYDKAAVLLKGTHGVNGAIASLLAGDIDEAEARVTCKCGRAEYVRAIIAARRGDAEGVRTHLANLESKSKVLYERSRKDVEFAKFR